MCVQYTCTFNVHFKKFLLLQTHNKWKMPTNIFIMQLLHLWACNKSMFETESRFLLCIKRYEWSFDRPSNKNKFIYLSRSVCLFLLPPTPFSLYLSCCGWLGLLFASVLITITCCSFNWFALKHLSVYTIYVFKYSCIFNGLNLKGK